MAENEKRSILSSGVLLGQEKRKLLILAAEAEARSAENRLGRAYEVLG